jgi:hypothetical protein
MAVSPLARKMKRRPSTRAAIINAPPGHQAGFPSLPRAATSLKGKFDWIQIFVHDQAQLKLLAPKAARALSPQGLLWVSFPKGSSRIQTDLTRDQGWDALRTLDLKWVSLVSVDETWSAFALRPYKLGEAHSRARS